MSYLATQLNGILRSRLSFGRIITRRCLIRVTNSNINTTDSRNRLPGIVSKYSQHIHRINSSYSTATETTAPVLKSHESRVPKILAKLSSNKVSLQFDVFKRIRPSLFRNYSIPIEDGFEILKSCSQLIDRCADERIQLVNDCWSELVSMVKTPTKDQLILLLLAYRRAGLKVLDNYQSFFEKYHCPIDADIFAELMYITCQNADTMENAESLLNDLDAQNIEPNEKIYSALILGYSKHGIEAIEKVLETMKSKNITQSLDTKTELIKAYVINEESNKAMELLQSFNGYSSDQLYDIIRCASIDGCEAIVKKALNLLPETIQNAKLVVPNLQNICIELVYLNRQRTPDKRLDPYQLILRHLPVNESNGDYGTFLLKEMIVAEESVPNILRFCEDLIENNRNLYAIHNCCMYSMVLNLPTACAFLKELATKERLRPHYFWPMLVRAKNPTDVIDVIKFATKLNVIFDVKTLQSYVLPRMNTLIDSQETIKALTSIGVRMLELKTSLIAYLLAEDRPKEALDIANRSTAIIDPDVIVPAVCKFIKSSMYKRNANTIVGLVKKLQSKCDDKHYDLAGQIVLGICSNRDKNVEFQLTRQLLNNYVSLDVNISASVADTVLDRILKNRNIHNELSPIIHGLVKNSEQSSEIQSTETKSPNVSNEIEVLEQQLSEFKANNFPIHGILYRLLMKHVQLKQYDQAIEVKNMCEQAGVLETPAVLSTLMKLWTATKNADKALEVLRTLQTKHQNFKLDSYKVIDLATLLINESRLEEAKQIIDKLPQKKAKFVDNISHNLWHLLDAAAQYGVKNNSEKSVSDEFLKTLVDKGLCEQSNVLLGTVIKEYLDKKQIHEAITAFEHYVTEYKKTPQSLSLLTLLIELSNDENRTEFAISKDDTIKYLQHVIDLLKEVHGSENTNVTIILAFACAGNEQQLRKILMNPVIKFNVDSLLKSLNYLKDRAKIEVVVALARSARGLQHESLKEDKLYEFLLNDFVRTNDYEAAIQLYEQLQNDDGSLVSKKFRKTLVELLVKNKQQLPEKLSIQAH